MTSTIKVTAPRDLIAAIPTLLGFHPREDVVLVFVRPTNGVMLTTRVDLDPRDNGEWVVDIVKRIQQMEPDAACLSIVATEGPLPDEEDRPWVDRIMAAGMTVRDDLWMNTATKTAGSFWCEAQDCCPFEYGEALVIPEKGIPMPSRDEIVEAVQFTGPDLLESEMALPGPDFWTVCDDVLLLTTGERPEDIPHFERAAVYLARAAVAGIVERDSVLAHFAVNVPSSQRWAPAIIEALARRSREPHFLTLLATFAYIGGEGAMAWALLDRADSIVKLSLSTLIERAMRGAVPPSVMREGLGDGFAATEEAMTRIAAPVPGPQVTDA